MGLQGWPGPREWPRSAAGWRNILALVVVGAILAVVIVAGVDGPTSLVDSAFGHDEPPRNVPRPAEIVVQGPVRLEDVRATPRSEPVVPSEHKTSCDGFQLCSSGRPSAQSWNDVPVSATITTALGQEVVQLEPLVGDYIDSTHRRWGDPAVVLRGHNWYMKFLECTRASRNTTWRRSCQQQPNMQLIKRERNCWYDSIEEYDLFQQVIPASLPSFERSYPKARGTRTILVDLGAREFESSSAALAKTYGKYGVAFDHLYAVEAQGDRVQTFVKDARSATDPNIAQALGNAEISLIVKLIDTVGNRSVAVGHKGVRAKVETLDVVEFLREIAREDDFVVVKMDIESAEYSVIPHMCKNGAFKYIDEFFVEVHFQEPERHVCIPKLAGCSKLKAIQLISHLRQAGVAAHLWV